MDSGLSARLGSLNKQSQKKALINYFSIVTEENDMGMSMKGSFFAFFYPKVCTLFVIIEAQNLYNVKKIIMFWFIKLSSMPFLLPFVLKQILFYWNGYYL